jgi:hypothetical protein
VRVLGEPSRVWLVVRAGHPVAGAALRAPTAALASPEEFDGFVEEARSPCLALLAGTEPL